MMFKSFIFVIFLIVESKSSCLTNGETSGRTIYSDESIPNALNRFTLKSYKQLIKDPKHTNKNILTSPYSLWSALTYTYLGSRGSSSDELGKVLGLSSYKKADVEQRVDQLAQRLSNNHKDKFLIANKLAFNNLFKPRNCLYGKTSFEIEALNFNRNPDAERKKLNSWVASKTNDKIKNLLPTGSIDSDTVTVLINAVFFKGNWKVEFEEKMTTKSIFTSSDGSKSEVDMMKTSRVMKVNLDSDNSIGAKGVELEYADGKFSMILALPSKGSTVDNFINNLEITKLNSFINNMKKSKVSLEVPKFKMSHNLSLKEHLSKIGASKMFKSLNISGILTNNIPTVISDVFHQSFVEINEKGTEAAAATAVISAIRSFSSIPRLSFNRPFVFFVKDVGTNAILFMGVVRDL